MSTNEYREYAVLTQLTVGLLTLVVAIVFLRSPPKKVNSLYGYRTPRSMTNARTWDEGNKYSAKGLLAVAVMQIIVAPLAGLIANGDWVLLLPVISLVSGFVLIIVLTERHLNDNFDAEGNFKNKPFH